MRHLTYYLFISNVNIFYKKSLCIAYLYHFIYFFRVVISSIVEVLNLREGISWIRKENAPAPS